MNKLMDPTEGPLKAPKPEFEYKPLTRAEREAAAWSVEHLIAKHSYDSILDASAGGKGGRVNLEELRSKLLGKRTSSDSGAS